MIQTIFLTTEKLLSFCLGQKQLFHPALTLFDALQGICFITFKGSLKITHYLIGYSKDTKAICYTCTTDC